MSALHLLQDQFQRFLLADDLEIEQAVVATPKVSVAQRLSIYKEGYSFRLLACLVSSFPAVHRYLGPEAFDIMGRDFIAAHPSSSRSIRWYGAQLSDFLRYYNNQVYAFLAELADFEWKMTLAFDAPDKTTVSLEGMSFVPHEAWVNLSFIAHPSLQRMNYFSSTVPLYKKLLDEESLPKITSETTPTQWIIWRAPDRRVYFYSLSRDEAWMLDGVLQGLNFSSLCEGLSEWIEVDLISSTAASYLKGWIQKGMIAELVFCPPST